MIILQFRSVVIGTHFFFTPGGILENAGPEKRGSFTRFDWCTQVRRGL